MPAAALLALASVSCSAPAAPTAGTRPDRFGAAAAQPSAPALPITLVGQSAFVRAGGDFNLVVRISPPAAAGEVEAVASVFPAVPNRSAFVEALTEVPNRLPLGISSPAVPDSEGLVGIRLQLQDPALPRDAERVWMGRRNGVHPVVVEVRDRDAGPVRNRLITFLVHLAEADPPAPLLFGLGVPVHVPVGTAPEGVARDARLDGLVAGLDAAGSLPLTLVPTPRTLDTLASFEDPSSGTLARLQAAAQSRPVLAGPYVPIDVPSLLDRRLDREIERQFQRGRETTAAVLGHPPDATTWASDTSLTDAAVERLHREGITRMVVPERLLVPITRQVTLTSPFLLRGEQARVPTLAADDGLGAHLGQGDQALRAHQLLADLAVLLLDLPGTPRGAVALAPRDWPATVTFFQTLRSGLEGNPIVRAATLDEIFALPEAEVGRVPLLRRAASAATPGPDADVGSVPALRHQLDALGTIFGAVGTGRPAVPPEVDDLEKLLLTAESSEAAGGRAQHLRRFRDAMVSKKREIRIPRGRSITLTSREGSVPVTFRNDTGVEALVSVTVASDKLSFPEGNVRRLVLTPRLNTTEKFRVLARTSGSFPVNITVQSPQGDLVVDEADLTVRSTAAPGLGLVIAIGAAGFLIVWWSRNARRVRRARRLVDPAERRRSTVLDEEEMA